MECFNDFCLNCDKQSTDGPYCSQTCRLADLEKASSNPASPYATMTSNSLTRSYTSPTSYSSSYSYDAVRSPATARPSVTSYKTTASGRLTPSSSRSSLASSSSTASTGLTEQARLELADYFSSFDQTRAAKRRSSVR